MTAPEAAAPLESAEALRIAALEVVGWRNLEPLSLAPGPRFNVVSGDNGSGKSSLLEAVDYLARLESFRGGRAGDLVQRGADRARLGMRVVGDVAPRTFRVTVDRARPRELSLDGKRPRSIAQWHGAAHVVLFHPGDVDLPAGGPEPRRALLDRVLGQLDPVYSAALASYDKALRSRNRLLRADAPDRRAIAAYDEVLASAGAVLGVARAGLVDELGPLAGEAFAAIVGEPLPLEVRYQPRVEPAVDALRAALGRALDKDLARGFTADGPHADELRLAIGGTAARRHASQGQHRAIVLALKVAELRVLTRRTGRVPLLLLDDVSSELDRGKSRRLFGLLAGLGGQVLLTTTHREFVLVDEARTDWRMHEGRLTPS
jgi:DNA replication and repair protein RecF